MDKPVEETVNRRTRGLDRAFDILDCLREAGRPLPRRARPCTRSSTP